MLTSSSITTVGAEPGTFDIKQLQRKAASAGRHRSHVNATRLLKRLPDGLFEPTLNGADLPDGFQEAVDKLNSIKRGMERPMSTQTLTRVHASASHGDSEQPFLSSIDDIHSNASNPALSKKRSLFASGGVGVVSDDDGVDWESTTGRLSPISLASGAPPVGTSSTNLNQSAAKLGFTLPPRPNSSLVAHRVIPDLSDGAGSGLLRTQNRAQSAQPGGPQLKGATEKQRVPTKSPIFVSSLSKPFVDDGGRSRTIITDQFPSLSAFDRAQRRKEKLLSEEADNGIGGRHSPSNSGNPSPVNVLVPQQESFETGAGGGASGIGPSAGNPSTVRINSPTGNGNRTAGVDRSMAHLLSIEGGSTSDSLSVAQRMKKSLTWMAFWGDIESMRAAQSTIMTQVQFDEKQIEDLKKQCDWNFNLFLQANESLEELQETLTKERLETASTLELERQKIDSLRKDNDLLMAKTDDMRRQVTLADSTVQKFQADTEAAQRYAARAKADLEKAKLDHAVEVVKLRHEANAINRKETEKEVRLLYLEDENGRQADQMRTFIKTVEVLREENKMLTEKVTALSSGMSGGNEIRDRSRQPGLDATTLQQLTQKNFQKREKELLEQLFNVRGEADRQRHLISALKAYITLSFSKFESREMAHSDLDANTGLAYSPPRRVPSQLGVKAPVAAPSGKGAKAAPKKSEPKYLCGPLSCELPPKLVLTDAMREKLIIDPFHEPLQTLIDMLNRLSESTTSSFSAVLTPLWAHAAQTMPAHPKNNPEGPKEVLHKELDTNIKQFATSLKSGVDTVRSVLELLLAKSETIGRSHGEELQNLKQAETRRVQLTEQRLQDLGIKVMMLEATQEQFKEKANVVRQNTVAFLGGLEEYLIVASAQLGFPYAPPPWRSSSTPDGGPAVPDPNDMKIISETDDGDKEVAVLLNASLKTVRTFVQSAEGVRQSSSNLEDTKVTVIQTLQQKVRALEDSLRDTSASLTKAQTEVTSTKDSLQQATKRAAEAEAATEERSKELVAELARTRQDSAQSQSMSNTQLSGGSGAKPPNEASSSLSTTGPRGLTAAKADSAPSAPAPSSSKHQVSTAAPLPHASSTPSASDTTRVPHSVNSKSAAAGTAATAPNPQGQKQSTSKPTSSTPSAAAAGGPSQREKSIPVKGSASSPASSTAPLAGQGHTSSHASERSLHESTAGAEATQQRRGSTQVFDESEHNGAHAAQSMGGENAVQHSHHAASGHSAHAGSKALVSNNGVNLTPVNGGHQGARSGGPASIHAKQGGGGSKASTTGTSAQNHQGGFSSSTSKQRSEHKVMDNNVAPEGKAEGDFDVGSEMLVSVGAESSSSSSMGKVAGGRPSADLASSSGGGAFPTDPLGVNSLDSHEGQVTPRKEKTRESPRVATLFANVAEAAREVRLAQAEVAASVSTPELVSVSGGGAGGRRDSTSPTDALQVQGLIPRARSPSVHSAHSSSSDHDRAAVRKDHHLDEGHAHDTIGPHSTRPHTGAGGERRPSVLAPVPFGSRRDLLALSGRGAIGGGTGNISPSKGVQDSRHAVSPQPNAQLHTVQLSLRPESAPLLPRMDDLTTHGGSLHPPAGAQVKGTARKQVSVRTQVFAHASPETESSASHSGATMSIEQLKRIRDQQLGDRHAQDYHALSAAFLLTGANSSAQLPSSPLSIRSQGLSKVPAPVTVGSSGRDRAVAQKPRPQTGGAGATRDLDSLVSSTTMISRTGRSGGTEEPIGAGSRSAGVKPKARAPEIPSTTDYGRRRVVGNGTELEVLDGWRANSPPGTNPSTGAHGGLASRGAPPLPMTATALRPSGSASAPILESLPSYHASRLH